MDITSFVIGRATASGGSSIEVEQLNASENKTYTAEQGKAFSPVVVSVPNSYSAGDEGKVVSNGALVAQTAHATVTENGTIDTTLNNSVEVNVSGGGSIYHLIYSGEVTASTTSTSETTVATISLPGQPKAGTMYYAKIRNKDGSQKGYHVGNDMWLYGMSGTSTSNLSYGAVCAIRHPSSAETNFSAMQSYGVYLSSFSPFTNTVTVVARYSSTYSLTIDGTYTVEIYELDYAPNGDPFTYL